MRTSVCVASGQRQIQNLIALAGLFDGVWWYTSFDPSIQMWIWQFDFPDLDRAHHFMLKLPDDCVGALPDRNQASDAEQS